MLGQVDDDGRAGCGSFRPKRLAAMATSRVMLQAMLAAKATIAIV